MTDFDFFDQYREKMRSLRPSEGSAGEDWRVLSQKLDATMPVAGAPGLRRYRMAAAAFLLLLLGSNLWWGFAYREQDLSMGRLANQLTTLQSTLGKPAICPELPALRQQLAALQSRLKSEMAKAPAPWPLPYAVRASAHWERSGPPAFGDRQQAADGTMPIAPPPNANAPSPGGDIGVGPAKVPAFLGDMAFLAPTGLPAKIPFLDLAALRTAPHPPLPDFDFPIPSLPEDQLPVFKKIAVALSPKTFRLGLAGGWLMPLSKNLQHQAGYSAGLRTDFGLSRRWGFFAEWNLATLHYKALAPNAAVGLASLPLPYGQEFLEMDVMNQRLLHYSLGLRHVFSPEKVWHPFVAGGWSGIASLPFMVDYETVLEPSGTIAKGMYETDRRSPMSHYLRFSAGADLPIGKRFDLSLEGSYLYPWRGKEPPFVGVRLGFGYLF